MKVHSPLFIHYVKDMDRAYTFYFEVLGLVPNERSPGWSTLRCGDALLALHILPAGSAGPMPHAGLNFGVDDLDAAVKEIEAGGGRVHQIREASGGVPVRLAEVSDPEGNNFELSQFVG